MAYSMCENNNKLDQILNVSKSETSIAEEYTKRIELRTAINLIPFAGSAFDVLLSGKGHDIQHKRILEALKYLNDELNRVRAGYELDPSEETWDLLVSTIEKIARSRSFEKRKRFANIIANIVINNKSSIDGLDVNQLLSQCEDVHIEILKIAYAIPENKKWDGLKIFRITDKLQINDEIYLPNKVPDSIDKSQLIAACYQLVGMGLLRDEGVGRYDIQGMQFLMITEAGTWFYDWIKQL